MADIKLTVGVDTSAGYATFRQGIDALVKMVNANPPVVKVKVQVDESSARALRQQLKASAGASGAAAGKTGGKAGSGEAFSSEIKSATSYLNALNKVESKLKTTGASLNKWTAAKNGVSSQSYAGLEKQHKELTNLMTELNNGSKVPTNFAQRFAQASATITKESSAIRAAGENVQSFGDKFSNLIKSLGNWFSAMQMVLMAVRAVKKMVTASIELENAFTQLKIVTNATDTEMKAFASTATTLAQSLGKSVTDIASSIEVFSRLGYNLTDASELAKYASMLSNVAAVSTEEATTGLTSIIKGYNMDVSNTEHVADVLVNVGQKYAVSASEMMTAFEKSGAALNATNTSFEKSAGLIAAANASVQNASTVGTALKTISARIRGSKTDLDELGEGADDLAEGFSKYAEEIKNLTGFDIMVEGSTNTFKDLYDILDGIAAVWDRLSNTQQARVSEILGGTRQLQVISSIIGNWKDSVSAYETAMNSAGVASKANATYMETTEAHIQQMQASFQALSSDVMSSAMLKFFVDLANNLLKAADSAVKMTDKLGGMRTVLIAIAGIVAALNIQNIIALTSKAATALGGVVSKITSRIGDLGAAISLMRNNGASLSDAMGFLGINKLSLGIGLVTTAITAVSAVYSKWRHDVETARQASLDAAETSAREADSIMELYAAYQTAKSAYADNTGTKEDLNAATDSLLKALGLEKTAVSELAAEYGTLDSAIQKKTLSALEEAASKSETGVNAAKDAMMDAFGHGGDFWAILKQPQYSSIRPNAIDKGFFEGSGKFRDKIWQIFFGDEVPLSIDLPTDSVEHIYESYNKLLDMRQKLQEGLTPKEYEDSNTVDVLEDYINYFETAMGDYPERVKQMNEQFAQLDVFEKLSKGVPKTAQEFSRLKTEAVNAAKSADGSGHQLLGTAEDIEAAYDAAFASATSYYPGLADVMNAASETAEESARVVTEAYRQADGNITQSVEKAGEATDALISQLSKVQEVISAQKTGKSLSFSDYNAAELTDYREALEYVNGSMQLNVERVNEITEAKAQEQIALNNTNKSLEQAKYLENAKQLTEYRQELERVTGALNRKSPDYMAQLQHAEALRQGIEALEAENALIKERCTNYDLMSYELREATSAYQNWLNASSASDYGDMADDTMGAIRQLLDAFNPDSDTFGDVGTKAFRAAVDFIVPDSVDREDSEAIQSYMESFSKYLTLDDNGTAEALNIDKFLKDAVDAGLMSYSEDNGFVILGNKKMEDFAEGLNLSAGMVQAVFDELSAKGGEFDWADEAAKSLGDLAVEASDAADALLRIKGNEASKIVIDVSDIDSTAGKVAALDRTISGMNDIKSKVNVDASEVAYANTVIEYCQRMKMSLTEPVIMNVDTSQVEGKLGNAIQLIQEFYAENSELRVLTQLKADTTDAQAKVDEVVRKIHEIPPDILTKIGIDDQATAAEIQSAIGKITPEMLGLDGTVMYQPDTDNLLESEDLNALTREVYYIPILDRLKPLPPVTRDVILRYTDGSASGSSGGRKTTTGTGTTTTTTTNAAAARTTTANAAGTANAGGNWGTARGGRTLVGELGREIVVDPRTGQWYTVGDHGAEFAYIPQGAIVFNHQQTEDLLAHGYTGGRALSLVSGTARVTGGIKPPSSGSFGGGGGGSGSGKGSGSGSGSKGSGSNKSTGSSTSTAKTTSTSRKVTDEKDDSKIIDWIEVLLDRVQRAIDRLATVAQSSFRTLSERMGATNDELSQVSYEMSVQQSAYDRYMKQANSVGLSGDLAAKVQNGTIDITEYSGETAEMIEDYQGWYEKALDCKDAMTELGETLSELYQDTFDNVATDFENQLSLLEHLTNGYNNGIDDLEERGYLASATFYEALRENEEQKIGVMQNELVRLIEQMNAAVDSGAIQKESEAWYDFQNQINDVRESIQEAETSVVGFNNAIRETQWEHFDYLQEQIGHIAEEADFLMDLMSHEKLYTDNGQLTDEGMATMGLHGENYNIYMAQADKYAEELKRLNADIANDPNNVTLLERREELLEAQRESILAAEDEKDAIVDMVKEGIDLELESLQKLIDKYNDSLDSAKDLYDYQKKVRDQTSEIASLQKQLSAYAGDDSEETRATVQRLTVDLQKATESLEETEYEHYIDEQKSLLSNLYDEYEMLLNERLDNIDALIADMIGEINASAGSIGETLRDQASSVGYTLSESQNQIWETVTGDITGALTTYDGKFSEALTNLNGVIQSLTTAVNGMVAASDKKAEETVEEVKKPSPPQPQPTPQPASQTQPQTKPQPQPAAPKTTPFTEDIKRGVATAIWAYGSGPTGWGTGTTRGQRMKAKFGADKSAAIQDYINKHSSNGDLYAYWASTGFSKLTQYYYSAFKKGGLATYTGAAWIDGSPREPEAVLNPKDTKNFLALKNAMQSVAHGDSLLAAMFGGRKASALMRDMTRGDALAGRSGTTIGNIRYEINIPIDHVQDYNDFMNQLRKDTKFEQMVQSMTVDRLAGGSAVAKNKFAWQ